MLHEATAQTVSIVRQAGSDTLTTSMKNALVARGVRPYLKARDIWDIKFLTDRQITADRALIARKLKDYGISQDAFKEKLRPKLAALDDPATAKAFHQKMSRFIDAGTASRLGNPALAQRFLRRAKEVGLTVLSAENL